MKRWTSFFGSAPAGLLGAVIGFERRVHHKAIGIAGMMLIGVGSTTYMLLGASAAQNRTRRSSAARFRGFFPGSVSWEAP